MKLMRRGHVDGIDVRAFAHLLDAVVDLGFEFFAKALQRVRAQVRRRGKLYIR